MSETSSTEHSAPLSGMAGNEQATASAAAVSGATSGLPVDPAWNVSTLTQALANAHVHKPPECFKLSIFEGTYEESAKVPFVSAAYCCVHGTPQTD